jgi:hypothetical protein
MFLFDVFILIGESDRNVDDQIPMPVKNSKRTEKVMKLKV